MDREIVGKIVEALMEGPKDWKGLKEHTRLADGTLAKYLKKMIKNGMISEEICEKDRRKKIYRLVRNEDILNIALEQLFAIRWWYSLIDELRKEDKLAFKIAICGLGALVMCCLTSGDRGWNVLMQLLKKIKITFEHNKNDKTVFGERIRKLESVFSELWDEYYTLLRNEFGSSFRIDIKEDAEKGITKIIIEKLED